jgi:thioredoxin 2
MVSFEVDERGIVQPCPSCGQKNRLIFERLAEPVKCGKCKQQLPPINKPIEIQSSADFDRLIARSSIPVVVDYWAPWCGPCRMMAPEIEKVAARQAGKMLVVKVNTDNLQDLGQRFGIRSIPTLAVFGGGRELTRSSGARPAEQIEALVDQAAGSLHR